MTSSRPGCLTMLARGLAGAAGALFVLLLPITLLSRNLALVIFSPPELSRLVSSRLVDEGTLRQVVVDNLFGAESSVAGIDLQGAAQHLSPGERNALIDRLLPATWVEAQILRVTTDFFAWFDSPATRLQLSVDLEPVRAALRGEAAADLVEAMVESWPACTLEDVTRMLGLGAVPEQEGFPYCEPPEPLRGLLVGALTGGIRLLAEGLPAEAPVVDQDFNDAEDLMRVKEQVRLVRFVSRWGILASFSLLGLIMALAVRSWRDLARWWGVPLLLGGVLSFVPVLLGGPLLRLMLARFMAGARAIPAVGNLVEALGGAIREAVLGPQAVEAVLIAGVGLVLVLLGFVRRKPRLPAATTMAVEVPAPVGLVPPADEDEAQTDGKRPSGMFG